MKFIGISGPIASGKSRLAEQLSAVFNALHYKTAVIPFATGLKELAQWQDNPRAFYGVLDFFTDIHVPFDDRRKLTDQVIEAFHMFPATPGVKNRRLMQYIGTEIGRAYNPMFWIQYVKILAERKQDLKIVISDDVRFDNESDHVDFHIHIDTTSNPFVRAAYKQQTDLFEPFYLFNDHASEHSLTVEKANMFIGCGFDVYAVLSLAGYLLSMVVDSDLLST